MCDGVRPEAAAMLRADGSVVVPPALAGDLLRRLMRDIAREAASTGANVSPAARALLHALQYADEARDAALGSDDGTCPAEGATFGTSSGAVEMTAREAADLFGCSTSYMRRLARSGRVGGRRVGRQWLLDSGSVDKVRRRSA